jgi:hypothetical protein
VTDQNKREIDKVIHEIVGVEYKNCPATWRKVKERLADDQDAFVSRLSGEVKKALKSRQMEAAS